MQGKQPPGIMAAPAPISALTPPATGGHVLVSDDDPAVRGALEAVLTRAGFSCRTADTADQTLSLLAAENFDLLVADIHMEGNKQLEMIRQLSDQEDAPPVILVTGLPSIETATQALRLRVFDYLLKPVDSAQLVALAREGVASGRIMKLLRAHRLRLKESLAEINRCETLARNANGTVLNAALGTYLSLAVQQSLVTIGEVGDLAAAIVTQDPSGKAQHRLQSARPLVLIEALRETIQVLEHTKGSFKSHELAELRKKIEALVKRNG